MNLLTHHLASKVTEITQQQQQQAPPTAALAPAPAPSEPHTTVFPYPVPPPDTADLRTEIEEFYSYVDIGQVLEHREAFEQAWPHEKEFVFAPKPDQLSFIAHLLAERESPNDATRLSACRALLYIAEGTFQSSMSPEHHLHLILSNAALLREGGVVPAAYAGLRAGHRRWEEEYNHAAGTDGGEETELAMYGSILYLVMEAFRGDEDWAEELMALDPPLPDTLVQITASLREKNGKGFPIKKTLLLLWKCLLSCFGSSKDYARVKALVREIEGLAPDEKRRDDKKINTKVSVWDYQRFLNETSSKYPTYPVEDPSLGVNVERLAEAYAPQPVRPMYTSYLTNDTPESGFEEEDDAAHAYALHNATPAPSPPPMQMGKPKKQQFQTDQKKVFVLPFAPANADRNGIPRVVPQSIEEASELYKSHLRVSTALWQTWKLREEFIADSTGIAEAARLGGGSRSETGRSDTSRSVAPAADAAGTADATGSAGDAQPSTHESDVHSSHPSPPSLSPLTLSPPPRIEGLSPAGERTRPTPHAAPCDDELDSLRMLRRMEAQVRAEERVETDTKRRTLLAQRAGDLRRLQRVERVYRAALPHMQSATVVVLKLLLTTITNNGGAFTVPGGARAAGDVDVVRHREITTKAITSTLLLLLRWLRVSHVMKHEFLAQLIVDSNGLLLLLKMFGIGEGAALLRTRHEQPALNFFRYCDEAANPGVREREPSPPAPAVDDGVELVANFSHRNFCSLLNVVHLLQKLTKHKAQRTLLLVQYKAPAALKRLMKITQPTLQRLVLKVSKSMVPFCGRKWRQANMKTITAIYMYIRPDLRDEWLGTADAEDAAETDAALRSLVSFYNGAHYHAYAPALQTRLNQGHSDVLPASPRRARDAPADAPAASPHSPAWTGDPELDDLFSGEYEGEYGEYDAAQYAWQKLGHIMGAPGERPSWDGASDAGSESSVSSDSSIRFFDFGAPESSDEEGEDAAAELRQRLDWQHLSPRTISALEEERSAAALAPPHSPLRSRRRSSSSRRRVSPALRPVLEPEADGVFDDVLDGPAPVEEHTGPPVDEVELVFGQ